MPRVSNRLRKAGPKEQEEEEERKESLGVGFGHCCCVWICFVLVVGLFSHIPFCLLPWEGKEVELVAAAAAVFGYWEVRESHVKVGNGGILMLADYCSTSTLLYPNHQRVFSLQTFKLFFWVYTRIGSNGWEVGTQMHTLYFSVGTKINSGSCWVVYDIQAH